MDNSAGITQLLGGMRRGDRDDTEQLVKSLYSELRALAASCVRREYRQSTLQPTELVAECFVRLFQGSQPDWSGRAHFFGVAARLMRQILVDRARRRRAAKRPDDLLKVPLAEMLPGEDPKLVQLLALDQALQRLEVLEPRLCRLVELRFFAGLDGDETAKAMGLSPATVRRDWNFARAWLHRELSR